MPVSRRASFIAGRSPQTWNRAPSLPFAALTGTRTGIRPRRARQTRPRTVGAGSASPRCACEECRRDRQQQGHTPGPAAVRCGANAQPGRQVGKGASARGCTARLRLRMFGVGRRWAAGGGGGGLPLPLVQRCPDPTVHNRYTEEPHKHDGPGAAPLSRGRGWGRGKAGAAAAVTADVVHDATRGVAVPAVLAPAR